MKDGHWNSSGGTTGIAYIAASAVAASLNGGPPAWNATNKEVQAFFIDHRSSVIAQAWLYALATALILWFAVVVRRVLYTASNGKHLGDLFLVSTAAVAALSFVSMSIRIVTAVAADQLSAAAVRAVGYDFSLALLSLEGFIVAAAALSYAACVIPEPVLPTWTAWLAILAAVVNLAGTTSVFFRAGVLSIEGNLLNTWLPGLSAAVWYLAVSVALFRARNPVEQAEPGFG
jgi:hypothetical protein